MSIQSYERKSKQKAKSFFVSDLCHPQNIAVLKTRVEALGLELIVGNHNTFEFFEGVFGVVLQYPSTDGNIIDYSDFIKKAKDNNSVVTLACDLLSLCLLKTPAELGADIAVGNSQRLGVPLGFGGPHAAFFATTDEFKRVIPGRLVGLSKDKFGKPAYRLALQTREQHIRREKATSNICTAQVLLAIIASMYAVFHGPDGLKKIARRVNSFTKLFASKIKNNFELKSENFFDTISIKVTSSQRADILKRSEEKLINLDLIDSDYINISFDETIFEKDLNDLYYVLTGDAIKFEYESLAQSIPQDLMRKSDFLNHPVFNQCHSETEFLRYARRLESRDLSLCQSMIPLGSCTMKLNAASEMLPVTWSEFSNIHPLAPKNQSEGYQILFDNLEKSLAEMTGFTAVSLQPNAGSQGEYAGLLSIARYHQNNNSSRNICIIPKSAHGTNPASAVMAGMKVVVTDCDENGNMDIDDLKEKVEKNKDNLAALMVTYPSTHGVFEEGIKDICKIIHDNGGLVYMDGANFNALLGLSKPAELGADVMHFNLHKTFCIPHGGGGPGVGPIAVNKKLENFLPGDPANDSASDSEGAVSATNYGSASILPISWSYICMMSSKGLKKATEVAILNANYIALKLKDSYPVLYTGQNELVAHECILDLRGFKEYGIEVEDIAKRLMDYGFHAPTVSWPVPGTLMIEPTESESRKELDRFCDAMNGIRDEIQEVIDGKFPQDNNLLKNSPHPESVIVNDNWDYPYSRERAAYPVDSLREYKFWPTTSRIDSVFGDRNLVCSCAPIEDY
ncbi:UNVERIFIED_CONTAM: hypothetical protein GTU68_053376 [Idotea baltica]|nr:hypothetical protein [Idotea baltica]